MFVRLMITVLVISLLVACSPAPTQDINERAKDLMNLTGDYPVFVSDDTWRVRGTLKCSPATKQICTSRGCEGGPATVWSEVTPSSGALRRCDTKGCDAYQAEVTHSGIWTTLGPPENTLMFRLTAKGDYLEVATSMDMVVIYRGKCRAM